MSDWSQDVSCGHAKNEMHEDTTDSSLGVGGTLVFRNNLGKQWQPSSTLFYDGRLYFPPVTPCILFSVLPPPSAVFPLPSIQDSSSPTPLRAVVFLLPSIGSPQMLLPHPSVLFPLPSMRHTRSHQLTCYRKALRDTAAPGVI